MNQLTWVVYKNKKVLDLIPGTVLKSYTSFNLRKQYGDDIKYSTLATYKNSTRRNP